MQVKPDDVADLGVTTGAPFTFTVGVLVTPSWEAWSVARLT
jgi:hypothetical protein